MKNLFAKTLHDKRAFLFGWSLGLAFVGFLITLFYPSFHQDMGLDQLIQALPTPLQGLIGDLADFQHVDSYLGSQLFDIRMPILLGILAIILAVGLSVGEEDKGYIRSLLALPLSRGSILWQKWLAIVYICFWVTTATLLGIVIGLFVIHETVDPLVLARLGAMTLLLAVALASFIFGIGIATGKRGLTMTLAVVVTVGSFLLATFAKAVDWLEPYAPASIFHYFPAVDIAKGTIEPFNIAIYVSLIAISLCIGLLGFRHRDVR